MTLATPYPKTHTQATVSPNPRAIIADGQIRLISESGAGPNRESRTGGGTAAERPDLSPMIISLLMQMWLPARQVTAQHRPRPGAARLNSTVRYCLCRLYDRQATVDKKTPLPSCNNGTNRQSGVGREEKNRHDLSRILDVILFRILSLSQPQTKIAGHSAGGASTQ